jgi:hypothetical protein
LLEVTPARLIAVAGARWEQLDQVGDPDERSLVHPTPDSAWFVAGDPVQVLLRVSLFSERLDCHVAEVTWHGHEPRVAAGRRTGTGSRSEVVTWLPSALQAAQTARRRSFRWCRYCRVQTAPEHMNDGVCHGCMTTYQATVF